MWSRNDEEEDNLHSFYRLPHPHHHPRPHDGAVQYSDEEEEAHIDIVGDDEDVDNGDVDDDDDEGEDDDEDEVTGIKTPLRRLLSTVQPTPPSGRSQRYTSPPSSSRSNLGRNLPCKHRMTMGSSSAVPGRPRYAQSSRIRCTKRSTRLLRRKIHGRRYEYFRVVSEHARLTISLLFQVCGWAESGEGGKVGLACEDSSCDAEHAQGQPERIPFHYVHSGQTLCSASHLAAGED